MKATYLFRSLIPFFLVLGITSSPFAGEPTEKIRQTTDKIISIISDPALKDPSKAKEKRRLIRRAVDERFDWQEMARRALARHWQRRTEEEKREFVRLFGQLVENTYMSRVENYSGEKVIYEGESIDKDYSVVRVKIATKKNTIIPVEYRLKKEGNDWLVYDVSIEGVSLINNYRTQFNGVISQSSYEELVKRLQAKVAQN
jgi:phospholipid transport system substrate-binding protein